jgi:hypothetical protein
MIIMMRQTHERLMTHESSCLMTYHRMTYMTSWLDGLMKQYLSRMLHLDARAPSFSAPSSLPSLPLLLRPSLSAPLKIRMCVGLQILSDFKSNILDSHRRIGCIACLGH